PSLPSFVRTATIRLRCPVSHIRIPSRVPPIPKPIATPPPISLRHLPFRVAFRLNKSGWGSEKPHPSPPLVLLPAAAPEQPKSNPRPLLAIPHVNTPHGAGEPTSLDLSSSCSQRN